MFFHDTSSTDCEAGGLSQNIPPMSKKKEVMTDCFRRRRRLRQIWRPRKPGMDDKNGDESGPQKTLIIADQDTLRVAAGYL